MCSLAQTKRPASSRRAPRGPILRSGGCSFPSPCTLGIAYHALLLCALSAPNPEPLCTGRQLSLTYPLYPNGAASNRCLAFTTAPYSLLPRPTPCFSPFPMLHLTWTHSTSTTTRCGAQVWLHRSHLHTCQCPVRGPLQLLLAGQSPHSDTCVHPRTTSTKCCARQRLPF